MATRSEIVSGVSAPTITLVASTVRPASARMGATKVGSSPSASSFGQASASAPAVIEPPETLETRSSRLSQPASCSRQTTPTWNSMAR